MIIYKTRHRSRSDPHVRESGLGGPALTSALPVGRKKIGTTVDEKEDIDIDM